MLHQISDFFNPQGSFSIVKTRKILASVLSTDFLVLLSIFGSGAIVGYNIGNITPANNIATQSYTQSGVTLEKKQLFIRKTAAEHDHPDLFANTDVNTQQTPKTPIKATPKLVAISTTLVPVIPEVTHSVITSGMAPVFYSVNTEQPVVFLTIDDGIVKDPAAISFMKKHHIVASLFLNDSKISDNYEYFKTLQSAGNVIENHTVNHLDLTKLTYAQQKKEICENADTFTTIFGKRPKLFRPPYGAFNNITRQAAADCGMTALIHWHAKANNGSVQYQQGDKLLPGDIVLMHFRKEVLGDLTAFDQAAQQAKLQPVLLEDWIK